MLKVCKKVLCRFRKCVILLVVLEEKTGNKTTQLIPRCQGKSPGHNGPLQIVDDKVRAYERLPVSVMVFRFAYINLLAFVIQILLPCDLWTSTPTHLSPPPPPLPKRLQQLDHLSVYYLNTCKKICLNFPLCFWSGLPPVFFYGPTESLVWPQAASVSVRRLLGAAIPPCIVPMPRVCASSHSFSTECLSWPCLFFSLRSVEALVPNTHRAQVGIHKKHLFLLPFTQTQ